ncbi:MAG TPA: hypothetical protein VFB42_03225 [Gaiellaceae bacterium]|nr:hypothetical protein [Gaiellaceae bacterium]
MGSMVEGTPPLGYAGAAGYAAARRAQAAERSAPGFDLPVPDGVPATPPAEVLAALDGAARVHEELRARGLAVTFDVGPEGDVVVRVVDDAGAVVRELPPAEALDVLRSEAGVEEL